MFKSQTCSTYYEGAGNSTQQEKPQKENTPNNKAGFSMDSMNEQEGQKGDIIHLTTCISFLGLL